MILSHVSALTSEAERKMIAIARIACKVTGQTQLRNNILNPWIYAECVCTVMKPKGLTFKD
jgi:hypothetical protein